jgi:hypothetical protein
VGGGVALFRCSRQAVWQEAKCLPGEIGKAGQLTLEQRPKVLVSLMFAAIPLFISSRNAKEGKPPFAWGYRYIKQYSCQLYNLVPAGALE